MFITFCVCDFLFYTLATGVKLGHMTNALWCSNYCNVYNTKDWLHDEENNVIVPEKLWISTN